MGVRITCPIGDSIHLCAVLPAMCLIGCVRVGKGESPSFRMMITFVEGPATTQVTGGVAAQESECTNLIGQRGVDKKTSRIGKSRQKRGVLKIVAEMQCLK